MGKQTKKNFKMEKSYKKNGLQSNQKKKGIAVGKLVFNIAALLLVGYVSIQYVLPMFNKSDDKQTKENQVSEATILANGDMVIQVSDVSEEAIFHSYEHEGTHVEVMSIMASDGTVRTAFNTCQVCYSSGRGYYVQDGDYLICQNCKNMFHRDMVEKAKGGCNPVPIFDEEIVVTDSEIVISAQYLKDAGQLFANWSRS